MAQLALLKEQSKSVVTEYFERLRLAEARRDVETAAVIKIQAYARSFLVRRRILHLSETALVIQRWWRGYLGRLRYKLAWELESKALRQAYFNAKATTIQKHWRGYYSRRYVHDFYARKAYLAAVRARNEEVRAEVMEAAESSAALQRETAQAAARRLFEDKVSKLHHLVSTATQPGIFNSPYAHATGSVPVVLGAPVEDHLKASMRMQVKTAKPLASKKLPPLKGASAAAAAIAAATGGSRSGSAGRHAAGGSPAASVYADTVDWDGKRLPSRLTLRQAADFQAVHAQGLLEEKVHRAEMLTKHPAAFASSLSKPLDPFLDLQTNRNLERYIDPFDPTVGNKGPRFTPEQARISKQAFRTFMHKQPFFDTNTVEGY